MATLDDKLLGEKLHYYCSSSEDEQDDTDDRTNGTKQSAAVAEPPPKFIPKADLKEWEGYSCNTGPKGVLKDWQRFKQLENEKRECQEAERLALMKKLSLTCQTSNEQEKEQKRQEQDDADLEKLLSEEDPFLKQYMQKRMQEMLETQQQHSKQQVFGKLIELSNSTEFLEAIDKEKSQITVIAHIYCKDMQACITMNGCLRCLAEDYPFIKFCVIEASTVGMSKHFAKNGVPALLVYKNGALLGNFVRVSDELGDDFFANDVESFLIDHGYLPDQSCMPEIVSKSIRSNANQDSDSE